MGKTRRFRDGPRLVGDRSGEVEADLDAQIRQLQIDEQRSGSTSSEHTEQVQEQHGQLRVQDDGSDETRVSSARSRNTDLATSPKLQATQLFHCTKEQARAFAVRDPFVGNTLEGFICRKEGLMGGSLYITYVNGKSVAPQIVYGVPKESYPYTTKRGLSKEDSHTWTRFNGPIVRYYLGNKWNGTNIQFFKYSNTNGRIFVSAKTKGAATANDCQFGDFLQCTKQALGLPPDGGTDLVKSRPELLIPLLDDPKMQSMSFELCGSDLPHLVKYNFGLALRPLFRTYYDGSIEPHICGDPSVDYGPYEYSWEDCVTRCQQLQQTFLHRNEEWRAQQNLKHRYEHDHFITEGAVLYLLDSKNRILNRTMYKVKPSDVEEVHWGQFDDFKKGQVRDAVSKAIQRGKPLTDESLREELDMGPKEWSKFGRDIMQYVRTCTPHWKGK